MISFASRVRLTQRLGYCHISYVFESQQIFDKGIIVSSSVGKHANLRLDHEDLDQLFQSGSRFVLQIEPNADDLDIVVADGMLESKALHHDQLQLKMSFVGRNSGLDQLLGAVLLPN